MRIGCLPFLFHLTGRNDGETIFFVNSFFPELDYLPTRKRIFSKQRFELEGEGNEIIVLPWNDFSAQRAELERLVPKLENGMAVFGCSVDSIAPELVHLLAIHGFTEIVYLAFGEWFRKKISIAKHRTLRSVLDDTFFKVVMLSRQLKVYFRKALLKAAGQDLRAVGCPEYVREQGHAWKNYLPDLTEHGDTVGHERSSLMLFEELFMLCPHQLHDDIRKWGRGRFSHWEGEVWFSTTDHTDPNHNGRRYRVVDTRGWKKLLVPFFKATPSFNLNSKHPLVTQILHGDLLDRIKPQEAIITHRIVGTGTQLKTPRTIDLAKEIDRRIQRDEVRGYAKTLGCTEEIDMLIGSLAPGGSERQVCYLAVGLHELGYPVRVLTTLDQQPASRHYQPMLLQAGVAHDYFNESHKQFKIRNVVNSDQIEDLLLLDSIPDELSREVWTLYSHLMMNRPQLLHCWLDSTNIIGAIAGWIAGVPKIVLSTRSLNPTCVEYIYRDWYRDWYRVMHKSPRVSFIANSRAGAASYAKWIGIPESRFEVVQNGIDLALMKPADPQKVAQLRAELGIQPSDRVAGAVFRFSEEKRPEMFFEIAAKLAKRIPNFKAIMAGVGPLEETVRAKIVAAGLEKQIFLLGRRSDIPVVISACDVLVLTSRVEGFPNVLMEAQALGCPVVSTKVGGTPEVVVDGVTGYLLDPNDLDGMVSRAAELLEKPELADAMGRSGRRHVESNFSKETMVEKTLKLYDIAPPQQLSRRSGGERAQLLQAHSID
ncbi:MAG: glycosyltransferase [Bdellovibrionota bacterium]